MSLFHRTKHPVYPQYPHFWECPSPFIFRHVQGHFDTQTASWDYRLSDEVSDWCAENLTESYRLACKNERHYVPGWTSNGLGIAFVEAQDAILFRLFWDEGE